MIVNPLSPSTVAHLSPSNHIWHCHSPSNRSSPSNHCWFSGVCQCLADCRGINISHPRSHPKNKTGPQCQMVKLYTKIVYMSWQFITTCLEVLTLYTTGEHWFNKSNGCRDSNCSWIFINTKIVSISVLPSAEATSEFQGTSPAIIFHF